MKFEVEGKLNLRGDRRKFAIKMEAESNRHLEDKVYAYFGSKYGIKRSSIFIENIKGE